MSDPSLNQVSQFAHFFTAAFTVLALGHWFGTLTLFIAFCAVGVVAAWKEFWYDEHYESVAVRGSSPEDFLFYMLGGAAGIVAYFL